MISVPPRLESAETKLVSQKITWRRHGKISDGHFQAGPQAGPSRPPYCGADTITLLTTLLRKLRLGICIALMALAQDVVGAAIGTAGAVARAAISTAGDPPGTIKWSELHGI